MRDTAESEPTQHQTHELCSSQKRPADATTTPRRCDEEALEHRGVLHDLQAGVGEMELEGAVGVIGGEGGGEHQK